jgi:pimeloyl-ACP methyl ester carboxylesterase
MPQLRTDSETAIENDLHVEILGNLDRPILMMHGWGQSSLSFRPLAEILTNVGQVHLVDLPGFGSSPAPPEDWDTIQYAERIHRYIDERKLREVVLIGHSFGGRVSIRLASRYPAQVESMILINSGGLRRQSTAQGQWRSQLIRIAGKACKAVDSACGSKLYEEVFVPKFASTDYKNAGKLRNILVKAVTEDVTADAQRITVPTFLLWGERDQETPLEMGERLHSLIKGSQLLVLPGKGHFPFMGDGSHLCAKYILRFLAHENDPRSPVAKEKEVK